jgi:hypothetical protein
MVFFKSGRNLDENKYKVVENRATISIRVCWHSVPVALVAKLAQRCLR